MAFPHTSWYFLCQPVPSESRVRSADSILNEAAAAAAAARFGLLSFLLITGNLTRVHRQIFLSFLLSLSLFVPSRNRQLTGNMTHFIPLIDTHGVTLPRFLMRDMHAYAPGGFVVPSRNSYEIGRALNGISFDERLAQAKTMYHVATMPECLIMYAHGIYT